MNSCPKCGSTSGFTYTLTITTLRRGDWGLDVDEEVQIKYANNPKTVKCDNCGARIDYDSAHNFEKSLSKTYAKYS